MCEPVSITSALIGVASAAVGMFQANESQKAQVAYQEAQSAEYARVAELNNQAAAHEFVEKSASERIGQMQEQEANSEQTQKIRQEALERKGTMMASTNTAGMALDALMGDYDREAAKALDNVRHQAEMQAVGHEVNVQAYKDKAQNTINSQQSYITPATSSSSSGLTALGTALNIASSGVTAYDKYKQSKLKGVK